VKTQAVIEREDAGAPAARGSEAAAAPALAIVMKGYPRLSETFIAQELLALQRRGLGFSIWAMRRPTDQAVHPMHREITAPVAYLPEYLYQEPLRVLKGVVHMLRQRTARDFLRAAWADLRRDLTANRVRRFGQACVLARELPNGIRHLHVHFLHTPASVVRYTAIVRALSWSFSAHAKDIWTTPDWEKREKIGAAQWGVTCTRDGHGELSRLADRPGRVDLVYHGLDLPRFPPPPAARSGRDGRAAGDPVRLVTIGRAVEKKGFDDLLAALALLPAGLHWRLTHIGAGELLGALKQQAIALKLDGKIEWLGSQTQTRVVECLRDADLFVLPSKRAANGDRDGLPNVVMEAASQALPIVATNFAGIPEFVRDGVEGWLVAPGDVAALAARIARLAAAPQEREQMGAAAYRRLAETFAADRGCDHVHAKLVASLSPRSGAA
jgi:glycosyltransferase involved in cell wall biosynthesis